MVVEWSPWELGRGDHRAFPVLVTLTGGASLVAPYLIIDTAFEYRLLFGDTGQLRFQSGMV